MIWIDKYNKNQKKMKIKENEYKKENNCNKRKIMNANEMM